MSVRPHSIGAARNGRIALAAGLLLCSVAAQAQSLVLYDDFTSGIINPKRWYGEEGKQYGGIRVEARRAVVAGQLRIEAKAYSDNFADSGSSTSRNSVVFAKSSAITAIRSSITLRSATITGCAANTTPSVARARIFGFFFNAGVAVPGSNYNDVYAGIQVSRGSGSTDAAGIFRVTGFIGKCTDDACISSTTVAYQDLGTATLGTATEVGVTWDRAAHRFAYQRATDAVVYLPYTLPDVEAASFPVKRMEISNQVAQCTSTRPVASAAADFDNVKTNVSPAQALYDGKQRLQSAEPEPEFDAAVGRVN
jgi:hypothetical protein